MIYFNKTTKHINNYNKILYNNPSKIFKIGDCLNNHRNGNTAIASIKNNLQHGIFVTLKFLW